MGNPFKGASDNSKQKHITCPLTGKRLSVSREAMTAINRYADEVQKDFKRVENIQKNAMQEFQEVTEILAGKMYRTESEDVQAVVQLDGANQIAIKELDFGGTLDLDDESKRVLDEVIRTYTDSINKILKTRSEEVQNELKQISAEAENQIKQAS